MFFFNNVKFTGFLAKEQKFTNNIGQTCMKFINKQIYPKGQYEIERLNFLFFLVIINPYNNKVSDHFLPFFIIDCKFANFSFGILNYFANQLLGWISTTNIFVGKIDSNYFLEGFCDNIIGSKYGNDLHKFICNQGTAFGLTRPNPRWFFGLKNSKNIFGIGITGCEELVGSDNKTQDGFGFICWFQHKIFTLLNFLEVHKINKAVEENFYLCLSNILTVGLREFSKEKNFLDQALFSVNLISIINIFKKIFNQENINFFIFFCSKENMRIIGFVFRVGPFRITIEFKGKDWSIQFFVLANLDLKNQISADYVLTKNGGYNV
jgi:hypothetical protein